MTHPQEGILRGDTPSVLIVSPDASVTELLAQLLGPHGLRVFMPHGEEHAIDAVRRTSADVVLLSSDCGEDMVQSLVNERFDPFVPVLLFSPRARAPSLEQLAGRHGVPLLELDEDVTSVVLSVRAAAGRKPLS